jgi:hypothetical protein
MASVLEDQPQHALQVVKCGTKKEASRQFVLARMPEQTDRVPSQELPLIRRMMDVVAEIERGLGHRPQSRTILVILIIYYLL